MSTCFMLVMMGSMKGFHLSSQATFQISTEISTRQFLLDTIRKHLNRGGCPSGPFIVFFPVIPLTSSTEDLMYRQPTWYLLHTCQRATVPKNCVSCGYQKIGTSFQQLKGIQLHLVILWSLKLLQAGNHTASSCNPTLNKDQLDAWS